jgi:hypothetical protein
MIIQSLVTAFIVAFVAIAVFGHVLLLRAAFFPRNSAQADQRPSRDAPVTAARVAA